MSTTLKSARAKTGAGCILIYVIGTVPLGQLPGDHHHHHGMHGIVSHIDVVTWPHT